MNDSIEKETFDTYIRTVENQEVKGILLKLKNEIRKSDVAEEDIKEIMIKLEQKDKSIAMKVSEFLKQESD